jgi:hypothetical protein
LKSYRLLHILGGGEFGDVYKGEYFVPQSGKKLDVAIKTVCENTELQYITLWQEIKIMAHIHSDGQHLNVIGFVGAVTTELRRGKKLCLRLKRNVCTQVNYIW